MRRVPHDGVPKIVTHRIPSHTLDGRSLFRSGSGFIALANTLLVSGLVY